MWTVQMTLTVQSRRVSTWELCSRPSHTQEYVNYNVGGVLQRNSVAARVLRNILAACSLFLHRICFGLWGFILQHLMFMFASLSSFFDKDSWLSSKCIGSAILKQHSIDHTYQKMIQYWWNLIWQCLCWTTKPPNWIPCQIPWLYGNLAISSHMQREWRVCPQKTQILLEKLYPLNKFHTKQTRQTGVKLLTLTMDH